VGGHARRLRVRNQRSSAFLSSASRGGPVVFLDRPRHRCISPPFSIWVMAASSKCVNSCHTQKTSARSVRMLGGIQRCLVYYNWPADHAGRCQAIIFSCLGARFRCYANMIARTSFSPHETWNARIRTECAVRVYTSSSLAVVVRCLRACRWRYTYMITGECLTPNKPWFTSV
jgi:hypothetical protein